MVSILLFIAIFAVEILVVLAVLPMLSSKDRLARRLSLPGSLPVTSDVSSLVYDPSRSPWGRLTAAIERSGLSLKDSEGEALAEKLMLAGYSEDYAVRTFILIKMALIIILPLIALIFMYLIGMPSITRLYLVIAGTATMGMYLPHFLVSSKATKRKQEILNGFPDALDLLLVCVDAGLGIDVSFSRVGAEIVTSHPLLAELLATVALELRAGRAREVAMRSLARRTALPELIAFVALLNQSAKLGSSISQALRVYSSEMREGRRMRAEEKAARLPVLLSIPLVAFLLPTMVAVLMLPAALTVHANLSSVKHVDN